MGPCKGVFSMNSSFSKEKLKAIELVKTNGNLLETLEEEFRNDKDVVLAAIEENPYSLNFASLELRNDPDVVIPALKSDEEVYPFVGRLFKIDRNISLKVVKLDGLLLDLLILKFKDDREVVRVAIQQNLEALTLASSRLQKDVDFVLDVIKGQEWAIKYAHQSLLNHPKVLSEVSPEILQPLQEEYQQDLLDLKNVWVERFNNGEIANIMWDYESELEYAELERLYSDEITSNEEFDQEEWDEEAEYMFEGRDWREEYIATIRKHFCNLPVELRSDKELVLAVATEVPDCLGCVSKELLEDEELQSSLIQIHGSRVSRYFK
jgi:hypothetical protein